MLASSARQSVTKKGGTTVAIEKLEDLPAQPASPNARMPGAFPMHASRIQTTDMTFTQDYIPETLTRAQADSTQGALVLEFGTGWCGFCRAAQPPIASAMARHPGVSHVKVEDGPGRPLGRSYRVKLWPTLIFLSNGQEVARLVRPNDAQAIEDALAQIDPGKSDTH